VSGAVCPLIGNGTGGGGSRGWAMKSYGSSFPA